MILKCARCVLDAEIDPLDPGLSFSVIPDAVTQIAGTALCGPCALAVSLTPGVEARDPMLRSRRFTDVHRGRPDPGR